ncbi:Tol-Pal system beta propeller repeat protein TolB [Chlorobaculum sp. 24CR]|uniref:Tol-Pal system beta propeller repeat protein TolB n=1 Tax=Chlorobaculum sp. 24CR TaxID=2508878 RepID=UPI00100AAB1E|nr:Tol-Pal system beta propeller repeat protein TolB [Chlorobaculum sp. 24CR]RXK82159.1 Tol-Pal system beta propeller repeat protein TolB [Chlorobaculum sp. 24CR]
MRNTRIPFIHIAIALCCILLLPLRLRAEDAAEYIAIRKEGASRIAIVLDKTASDGARQAEWARSLDNTINKGLDFTGLFNLLPAPLNIRNAQGGALNLASIASVGGDIYAGGSVTKKAGKPVLEMHVYDTSGKSLLARAYTGDETQLRAIGLRFCADLVELLTGKRSVFGTKIVFVSNRTGHKEVYTCDFDGENVVQLTNSNSISLTPVISPDGNYIAWTDYTSGRPDLYIKNLATGAKVSVNKHGVCISPAWRPGTNTLVTTLSYQGDQDLYLIRADGTVERRLTKGGGIDVSPSFSPDGSKMAFVSTRQGGPQIFIQDMNSGQARRLTYSGTYNTQPSWSPSGDKILYSSMQKSGEINIFMINADGSRLLQLTSGAGNNEYPSWSPDGSMIVFSSTRDGKRKLYVMNVDGANQKPLLRMAGEQQQPSWSGSK